MSILQGLGLSCVIVGVLVGIQGFSTLYKVLVGIGVILFVIGV